MGPGGWLVAAPILALTLGHIFSNAVRTLPATRRMMEKQAIAEA